MTCAVEEDLRRYQIQIDKQDEIDAEHEELEAAAKAEFKAAIDAVDMSRPMANTSMPIYHSDADGHSRRLGKRMCTFSEVIYDFMDDEERSDVLLRALVMCARKGNIEAIEAMEQVEAEYIKTYVTEELKTQQGAIQ